MAICRMTFLKLPSATGGPFQYVWTVDQVPTGGKSNVGTAGAVVDDFKALVAALPGSIVGGSFMVNVE